MIEIPRTKSLLYDAFRPQGRGTPFDQGGAPFGNPDQGIKACAIAKMFARDSSVRILHGNRSFIDAPPFPFDCNVDGTPMRALPRILFDNTNHDKACCIPHHDDGNGEWTEVDDGTITITESCCGIEYDMDEGPPIEHCIMEAHTTEPSEVNYFDEDGNEDGNRFVVTCEENGCSKMEWTALRRAESENRGKRKRAW
jgi:hypothetical protein